MNHLRINKYTHTHTYIYNYNGYLIQRRSDFMQYSNHITGSKN